MALNINMLVVNLLAGYKRHTTYSEACAQIVHPSSSINESKKRNFARCYLRAEHNPINSYWTSAKFTWSTSGRTIELTRTIALTLQANTQRSTISTTDYTGL